LNVAEVGHREPDEQTRGSVATRRVYHVTDSGEETFDDWMRTPLKYQRTRDAAHLKAAYLESVDHETRVAFLNDHIAHWTSELECWEDESVKIDALTTPMLNGRLEVTAMEDREKTIACKRFAYEGLADRAKTEIAWARKGLELVNRFAPETTVEKLAGQ